MPRGQEEPPAEAPRLLHLGVVVGIQGAFLAGVYALAFLYLPPGRMEPIDSLAPPGGKARVAVRVKREEPFLAARGIEGVELVLKPLGIGGPRGAGDAGKDPVSSAFTDADGVATFEIEAAGDLRSSPFLAQMKDDDVLPADARPRAGAKDCEVVLGIVPLTAPLLLVSVPDAISAEIDEDGGKQRPGGLAAKLLKEEQARGKGVVYIATAPAPGALNLRHRLKSLGFPEAPILVSAQDSLRQHISRLDLARWKGERWAVTASRQEAVDFAFHGFRAILLGAQGGSLVDGRSILSAPDWAAAMGIIAGPVK